MKRNVQLGQYPNEVRRTPQALIRHIYPLTSRLSSLALLSACDISSAYEHVCMEESKIRAKLISRCISGILC
jgi:pantothenate kinase-related protein Tda10